MFAGRIPPFAILVHRGRVSGRIYRTPIFAFPAGGGFVIALTYGRGTDWERNLFAAGGGEVVYRGRRRVVRNPAFIPASESEPYLPAPVRVPLGVFGVTDFMRLEEPEAAQAR